MKPTKEPAKDISAIKDQIVADLEQIKQANKHTAEKMQKTLDKKLEEMKKDLSDIGRLLDEQTGKTNWQLQTSANKLTELREVVYEYLVPTQDPYSYNATTGKFRFDYPELALLQYLRAFLPVRNALDIGSHEGFVSELLLSAGYRVYAFEPNTKIFEGLRDKFADNNEFRAFEYAIGAEDGHAALYQLGTSDDVAYMFSDDLSVYATLVKHAVPDGVWFKKPEEVQVRTLKTLHQSRQIPLDVSVVFTDTEGGDLDVIHGMGKTTYNMIVSKFWDEKYHFSDGHLGYLPTMCSEMRKRGYTWHLAIYRITDGETSTDPRWYANVDQSPEQSWGYAMFFKDYSLFTEAYKWCTSNLRRNETFR